TGKQGGTVPKKSHFACAACGTAQDVLSTVRATSKTGPMTPYAIQGYAPDGKAEGASYNGRFFSSFNPILARQLNAAMAEWDTRSKSDLEGFWPVSAVPFGFMTALNNGDIRLGHGYTHWWTMFNPRQLLVLSQLLKSICTTGQYGWNVREFVLGAFQQYLR